MSETGDKAEGGLLGVLRSRGLMAAMIAPSSEGAGASDSSAGPNFGVEFDETGEGVVIDSEISELKDSASKFEALRRKYQLNLNDPEQLSKTGLEDPALILHTAVRRQRLLDLEREQNELPTEEFLDQEDIKARRALSTLVTTLEDLRNAVDSEACTVLGMTAAAGPVLGRKLKSVGDSLTGAVETIRLAQNSLTVARRSSEMVIDGIKRRAVHFKEVHAE